MADDRMELVSTAAQSAIEMLLNIHALANMNRASGNKEYLDTAAAWLPRLETQMRTLRRELEAKGVSVPGGDNG